MSVVVRPAEPGDAAELVALASAVGGEPEGWLLTDERWRSVGDERRYIRAVRRSTAGAVLVAVRGDEIIGRLSIARDPQEQCSHVADLGLMVAREHRRRGVGRALMAAAERWARAVGITKLELHVFPYNAAAIRLYEQAGYEREGLRRAHYRRPDGGLVDAILMAKLL
jgi:RimJ/RimL family protein N-acetyltransferase